MRFSRVYPVSMFCCLLAAGPIWAANPEDEDIPEDVPPAPAQPAPAQPTQEAPPAMAPEPEAAAPIPAAPPTAAATGSTPAANNDTITVPRAVWEQLLRDVEDLKRKQNTPPSTASAGATSSSEEPAPLETPGASSTGTEPGSTGNRNYLTLPDISLILQSKGLLSSDKRNEERNKLSLAEAELAIQGYVYPNVKFDAFIVGAPAEDEPLQVEEGFLTFMGLRKGLNLNIGRKFAPFGRTGELHSHSWLYNRQLLPIGNLVSGEALVGDGVNLHYLLPLKGKTFVRASLGAFSGQGTETQFNASDPGDPFFGGIPSGPGAGFTDRFYNGRLWLGHPVGESGELDFGLSHARGTSAINDDGDNPLAGRVNLTGLDATYRHYMGGGKRLLLRGEYFKYKPGGALPTSSANGWYGLANYRLGPFNDIGLLYERSGFPQAPGKHENALSLIYTKQFTEQFYIRLMGTRGDRPGQGGYNELRLQFTAGIGPHAHTLE